MDCRVMDYLMREWATTCLMIFIILAVVWAQGASWGSKHP